MAIKASLGKPRVEQPFETFVSQQLDINGIKVLPIQVHHVAVITSLPFHHRDPFDRMLIAQAQIEHMPLLSNDSALDAYGITRVW